MPDTDDLQLLIRSRHPLITMETVEEQRAVRLVRRACEEMGLPLYVWTVVDGLRREIPAGGDTIAGTESPKLALAHLKLSSMLAVFVFKDLCGHLRNAKEARLMRDLIPEFSRDERSLILLDHATSLPGSLQRIAVACNVHLPRDEEIEKIIRGTFSELARFQTVSAKLKRSDLNSLVKTLTGLTEREIVQAVSRAVMDDDVLDPSDLDDILAYKRGKFMRAGVLEYVSIAAGDAELGGLARLRNWLAKRRQALSPKAREFGLDPPRGILLLGVQGCGKSLAAKAVAADWRLPLLRLDPATLYDKYVGETERHLRGAFRTAESMAPIVLWIDEIEKAFASASTQSTDGGLSRRMFGSLLNWMQEHRSAIFCVATANDISALPPELLRKGRFDEVFFVDLPDAADRETIFSIHLRKRKRDPQQFDLPALAAAADGFSGAEIEQAVVGALYSAFAQDRDVRNEDLLGELRDTRPLSVTMAEKVADLRRWAEHRCVPAG